MLLLSRRYPGLLSALSATFANPAKKNGDAFVVTHLEPVSFDAETNKAIHSVNSTAFLKAVEI